MVRLAIDCGLEAPGGRITAIAFCQWFAIHYNDLRGRAGLPALDTPSGGMTAEERELITISNVLRTHADYFASRSTSLEYKKEWMKFSEEAAFQLEEGVTALRCC